MNRSDIFGIESKSLFKKSTLAELLDGKITGGFSPPFSHSATTGLSALKILKLNAIDFFDFDPSQAKPMLDKLSRDASAYTLKPGQFLLTRAGTIHTVGRSTLIRQPYPKLVYPDLVMSFSVDRKKVEPEFLELCLFSQAVRNYLGERAAGTNASMVKINQHTVANIPLLLPPLAQQQQLLPLIRALRQALQGYKQLASLHQNLLLAAEKLFTQELRLKKTGARSKSWPQRLLGELFTEHSKHSNRGEWLTASKWTGIIPRSTSTNKTPAQGKMVQPGDFVISLRSSEGGIELSQQLGLLSSAYTILRPRMAIVPAFYRFLFKSQSFVKHTLCCATSGSRGDGKVDWNILKSCSVCHPPIAEQTEIADLFLHLNRQIQLEKEINQNIYRQLFHLSNLSQKENLGELNQYDPHKALVEA